jgi:hypothetical protein
MANKNEEAAPVSRAHIMDEDGKTGEWKSQLLPAYQRRSRVAKIANSLAITGRRENMRTLLLRFRPATRFLCSPALCKNK